MDKKSIVNDLYQAAVISVLAVGYSMLGKKILSQQRIDFINNQLRLERKAETKFTELNEAMREYHDVFGHELQPLPREPVLSDFYTPNDEQHYRELGFIALSMNGIR